MREQPGGQVSYRPPLRTKRAEHVHATGALGNTAARTYLAPRRRKAPATPPPEPLSVSSDLDAMVPGMGVAASRCVAGGVFRGGVVALRFARDGCVAHDDPAAWTASDLVVCASPTPSGAASLSVGSGREGGPGHFSYVRQVRGGLAEVSHAAHAACRRHDAHDERGGDGT